MCCCNCKQREAKEQRCFYFLFSKPETTWPLSSSQEWGCNKRPADTSSVHLLIYWVKNKDSQSQNKSLRIASSVFTTTNEEEQEILTFNRLESGGTSQSLVIISCLPKRIIKDGGLWLVHCAVCLVSRAGPDKSIQSDPDMNTEHASNSTCFYMFLCHPVYWDLSIWVVFDLMLGVGWFLSPNDWVIPLWITSHYRDRWREGSTERRALREVMEAYQVFNLAARVEMSSHFWAGPAWNPIPPHL